MKSIVIFNNKGGVGKTTLAFHLAHALSSLGHKTLLMDLDPQSNLTLFGQTPENISDMWREEDFFIEDFGGQWKHTQKQKLRKLLRDIRSIHFRLKPTEDGVSDPDETSRLLWLTKSLALLPSRLTLHMYEDKIATRWNDAFKGEPLALRTISRIRQLCEELSHEHKFKYILIDTSPSLGALNKVVISTADGFLIPCMPDMFSLYGIRNIGRALESWHKDYCLLCKLLPDQKREYLPKRFVNFLGFTVFNARKYSSAKNPWNLATAHYNYAKAIPKTIRSHISNDIRKHINKTQMEMPIGGTSVMHSHSTLPNMAQKYRLPIWKVPKCSTLEEGDKGTITGNKNQYFSTEKAYKSFAEDLLQRISGLEKSDVKANR